MTNVTPITIMLKRYNPRRAKSFCDKIRAGADIDALLDSGKIVDRREFKMWCDDRQDFRVMLSSALGYTALRGKRFLAEIEKGHKEKEIFARAKNDGSLFTRAQYEQIRKYVPEFKRAVDNLIKKVENKALIGEAPNTQRMGKDKFDTVVVDRNAKGAPLRMRLELRHKDKVDTLLANNTIDRDQYDALKRFTTLCYLTIKSFKVKTVRYDEYTSGSNFKYVSSIYDESKDPQLLMKDAEAVITAAEFKILMNVCLHEESLNKHRPSIRLLQSGSAKLAGHWYKHKGKRG